ncbi:MAG: hypothetical protein QGF00_01185 [Planctomycetota bacterium]|jgi:hypothetical protein|nr:hypothetical protein [Planctomycetota bacterium]MDP7248187.1 hypothetical protein [Planctomycetota bacterium]
MKNSANADTSLRRITNGPKFHWFGYYDKLQFDPSCRFVLGMEVDFEHRSPTENDVIKIGMVDLEDDDCWIELGETRAWCWQQGCMLQWRPGSNDEILWNDFDGDHFVCHIKNVNTGEERTFPHAIYTVSADGKTAVAPDFRRIQDMRPGYGYPGLPDPCVNELAPADSGIYRLNLETGDCEEIISIAQVVEIPNPNFELSDAKHYFNHLLFNTDGSRFIFLHRCRASQSGFHTRMMTAAPDGSDIRVVDDFGRTSHFIWRDTEHILAWSWHPSKEDKFYLYKDGTREVEVVGEDKMLANGHCTYLPDTEWVLNDTYPMGEHRTQSLYLYHVPTDRKIPLGDFPSPEPYQGEWRCDLHPRFSPDGKSVVIDSAHEGSGRQMYLIDVSELLVS